MREREDVAERLETLRTNFIQGNVKLFQGRSGRESLSDQSHSFITYDVTFDVEYLESAGTGQALGYPLGTWDHELIELKEKLFEDL